MAPSTKARSHTQDAEIVRVDSAGEVALLQAHDRDGRPGRTQWAFLKNLDPEWLLKKLLEKEGRAHRTRDCGTPVRPTQGLDAGAQCLHDLRQYLRSEGRQRDSKLEEAGSVRAKTHEIEHGHHLWCGHDCMEADGIRVGTAPTGTPARHGAEYVSTTPTDPELYDDCYHCCGHDHCDEAFVHMRGVEELTGFEWEDALPAAPLSEAPPPATRPTLSSANANSNADDFSPRGTALDLDSLLTAAILSVGKTGGFTPGDFMELAPETYLADDASLSFSASQGHLVDVLSPMEERERASSCLSPGGEPSTVGRSYAAHSAPSGLASEVQTSVPTCSSFDQGEKEERKVLPTSAALGAGADPVHFPNGSGDPAPPVVGAHETVQPAAKSLSERYAVDREAKAAGGSESQPRTDGSLPGVGDDVGDYHRGSEESHDDHAGAGNDAMVSNGSPSITCLAGNAEVDTRSDTSACPSSGPVSPLHPNTSDDLAIHLARDASSPQTPSTTASGHASKGAHFPAGVSEVGGVEVRRSGACSRQSSARKGESPRALDKPDLGVFTERAVPAGEVIFEEDALLGVSRGDVDPAVWDKVTRVANEVKQAEIWSNLASSRTTSHSMEDLFARTVENRELQQGTGVCAMDLLQAVAFHAADTDVQTRVLDLFSPDPKVFPVNRRRVWSSAMDMLHDVGLLKPSRTSAEDADRSSVGQGAAHEDTRGVAGSGGLEPLRRSLLSKVVMICEANIFGESDEGEVEDGPRSLYEVACRINHSCWPNCVYEVQRGRITVRAIDALEPGAELFASYLSMEQILLPTPDRREHLLLSKYFNCRCGRCSAEHDFTRGFRCPRCCMGTLFPPNPEYEYAMQIDADTIAMTDAGRKGDAGGDDHAKASGITVCSACGLVPTHGWLTSAESVENELREMLSNLHSVEDADFPLVLARLYAVGLYLFMDHWVMTFLHRDIANVLEREARMEEAAYHYHQGVHMLLAAFDRPTKYTAMLYSRLTIVLAHAAGTAAVHPQVWEGGHFPPTFGDGGTYASLVQTPFSGRTFQVRSQPSCAGVRCNNGIAAERTSTDSTGRNTSSRGVAVDLRESENCRVCGRQHGRPCDLFITSQSAIGRQSERSSVTRMHTAAESQDRRRMYLEYFLDVTHMALVAISIAYGSNAQETLKWRDELEIHKEGVVARSRA